VLLTNLGYLRLLEGDYASAGHALHEAAALASADNEAILRIALWQDSRVAADAVTYPTRWVAVRDAALANEVTLLLAQGRPDEAEALARRMMQDQPEGPWGPAMLGWVLKARGDAVGANAAWEQALERTRDTQDREAIVVWLQSVPA
jgi:Flp pilus assembly protein TadD